MLQKVKILEILLFNLIQAMVNVYCTKKINLKLILDLGVQNKIKTGLDPL